MPLKGAYASYPLKPEERVFEGRPDGELTGDCINGWYLSTDIRLRIYVYGRSEQGV